MEQGTLQWTSIIGIRSVSECIFGSSYLRVVYFVPTLPPSLESSRESERHPVLIFLFHLPQKENSILDFPPMSFVMPVWLWLEHFSMDPTNVSSWCYN